MFAELLSYDPDTIDSATREQVANILKARSEILQASAEVGALRARVWAGEAGLEDVIDLKAADLAKLREDYINKMGPFVQSAVDLEELKGMLPMFGMALLQTFKVPMPVVLEALGADVDQIMLLIRQIKSAIEDQD